MLGLSPLRDDVDLAPVPRQRKKEKMANQLGSYLEAPLGRDWAQAGRVRPNLTIQRALPCASRVTTLYA